MKKKDTIKWKPNMKWKMKKNKLVDELYGYNFDAKVYKAQQELSWAINEALYGKPRKDTRTIWQKRIDAFKEKISDIRVKIAQWIGGDALHENCDY